jgi:hypothetical protein
MSDKLILNDEQFNKALECAYRAGFSDSGNYLIHRDFKDTPLSSGYFRPPKAEELYDRMMEIEGLKK